MSVFFFQNARREQRSPPAMRPPELDVFGPMDEPYGVATEESEQNTIQNVADVQKSNPLGNFGEYYVISSRVNVVVSTRARQGVPRSVY